LSREDFVAVGVRLFAVYVLFWTLETFPSAMFLLSGADGKGWAGLYIAVLVLAGLLCAFLWFFPLSIARKLLPVMREPRSEQAIGAPVALSLGLTLIGIWFLASALVDVSYWLTIFIRSKQDNGIPVEWTPKQIASMVATLTRLLLSVWLIFGAAGIRRLIYKFRYGEISAP
jgi:hypothetical protein